MTKKASEIPSVVAMSAANIAAEKRLRDLIVDYMPKLFECVRDLGNDTLLRKSSNPDISASLEHVSLAQYIGNYGEIHSLLCDAAALLADNHNQQTKHAEDIGLVMDAPNGGGTDR